MAIIGKENIPCPACGGELKFYDTCKRSLKLPLGLTITLLLRRLLCEDCKKTHRELPDFVIPYKRYCRIVIERLAHDSSASDPYDERTRDKIRTWFKKAKVYFHQVWEQQVKLGFAPFGVVPKFALLVRATVNSGNWRFHSSGHEVNTF
jgi:hypothetical protein